MDEAVNYKRTNDVSYFTPPTQFLIENRGADLGIKGSNVMMLKNSPPTTPRPIGENESYCMDDDR